MNHALTALTEELRRLKAAGVKTVSVSDESLALLRAAHARGTSSDRGIPAVEKQSAAAKSASEPEPRVEPS